jgi:hypothetical protein
LVDGEDEPRGEEQESARLQHTTKLGDRFRWCMQMLEHFSTQHHIERRIGYGGEIMCIGDDVDLHTGACCNVERCSIREQGAVQRTAAPHIERALVGCVPL